MSFKTPIITDRRPLAIVLLVAAMVMALNIWLNLGWEERTHVSARLADAEHAAMCERFGLAPNSARHSACMAELLELRNRYKMDLF
jgi:hypothetical protein